MAEDAPKTTEPTTEPTTEHKPPSTSDLASSAKIVAEAAQAAATQQTDKIDKAKVAGAAEDLLEAAKSYGKLDEQQGVGQYLDKAQDYLHQMHESGGKSEEKEKPSGDDGPAGSFMKVAKGFF